MALPDETFIVRVRRQERDAVLEQPRLSRRRQVNDVADVGAVILRWLDPGPPVRRTPPTEQEETCPSP